MHDRKFAPFLTTLLVIAGLLHPAEIFSADVTKTLISGQGAIGARDGANHFSTNGGLSYAPAFIVAPHPSYSTIPGTKWISLSASAASLVPLGGTQTTIYRTQFNLPTTAANPSLTVDVHADNRVTIFLNGNLVGAQAVGGCPASCPESNFQDPPESFVDSNPAHFQKGLNQLEFVVDDHGVVTGLDYKATVTYTVDGAGNN